MKKLRFILLLWVALEWLEGPGGLLPFSPAQALFAQTGSFSSISFPVQQPPPQIPPNAVSISNSGTAGSTVYYYWIVTTTAVGNSAPSGPIPMLTSNGTLSGSNYNIVNWPASYVATGATTYDVLRTTTITPPTGACACAVATALSSATTNDQSNSLSAYTVATYNVPANTVVISNPIGAGLSYNLATPGGSATNLTAGAFVDAAANAASAGVLRLATGSLIDWRNAGNSANVTLGDAGAAAAGTANAADLLLHAAGYQGALYADTSAAPANSGVVRTGNATTAVAARNAAGNGDVALLASNASNQAVLATLAATTSAVSFTSPIFLTNSANPATAGIIELATGDLIDWRNAANGANVALSDAGAAAAGTGNLADDLKWSGGGIQGAAFVDQSAAPAQSGVLRTGSGTTAVAARNNAAGGDVALLASNASDQAVLATLAATTSAVSFTSPIFSTNTASPATAGIVRLASADTIGFRNNANSANISLSKTGAASGGFPADTFDTSGFGATKTAYTKSSNQTLQVITANVTTSATTLAGAGVITGLNFTAPASVASNWSFACDIVYSQATAAAANLWGVTTAGTAPTNLLVAGEVFTSLAGANTDGTAVITTATSTTVVTATPSAFGAIGTTADMFTAHLRGTLEAPSNASPTQVGIAVATGNASDALTVYRGSSCYWY